jgi:hypothetical protein
MGFFSSSERPNNCRMEKRLRSKPNRFLMIAIKRAVWPNNVLPEEFAKNADRPARFRREAKLPFFLNHHNIAAIRTWKSDGIHFLVPEPMEDGTGILVEAWRYIPG